MTQATRKTGLLAVRVVLTRADHQTHRRFSFEVPAACRRLDVQIRYSPKFIATEASDRLVQQAVSGQSEMFASRVGPALAQRWAADFLDARLRVPNLVTISLDDATGTYRGAAHRHSPEQELWLRPDQASPGLVAGPLPPGRWTLTLTAHTVVSDQCVVDIQIGAETASNPS
ncbi:MAG: hypothetical protein JOZ87_38865 [Chloroflexi bacterium]|nr:hypothetical protein [Chloroflexota bacterium]